MPCPIFGNTYRNTKQSRNGWMSVRSTNSQMCLRSTTTSRSSRAPSAVQLAAAPARGGAPPPPRAGQGDENGLRGGPGGGHVDQVEALALGGQHDARAQPVRTLHVQFESV